MSNLNTRMTNTEPQDSNRKNLVVDPIVTTISLFLLLEIFKATLSFFVQKMLGWWWDRKDKHESDEGIPRPQQSEET